MTGEPREKATAEAAGGEKRNNALRRARLERDLSQEEIVEDLNQLAARLYAEGCLPRAVSVSERQYRTWESPNPGYPHQATRQLLEAYFHKHASELGFKRRTSMHGSGAALMPGAFTSGTRDSGGREPWTGRSFGGHHGVHEPDRSAPLMAVAPGVAGDPTDRRTLVALTGSTALTSLIGANSASADTVRAFTRRTSHSDLAPQDVEDLELAVHRLGATYSAHSPAELWPVAARYRERAAALLEGRHTLRQGRALAHQAGMLSVVLAWLAHDLGRRDLVGALCDDAWQHGREADSPEVCAWAEDVRCTDALYDQRPLDALTAATRGLAVAPGGSNAAVRLSAQLARTQARVGNQDEFARAAGRAEVHRENIPLHGVGLFAADAVRIVSFNASSHGWLGQHRLARDAAQEAISLYESVAPGRAPTRLAIARLDLALAHAALGEPEASLPLAQQALKGDRVVQSIRDRARQLGRTLLTTYPSLPQVQAFGEEVRSLT
ncbi:hypothetical protein [Streptomyces litchfieldiae]|uniref:XRE family transcriptional regulator n=1 Tax=Streptomyces litchfieldiae TaxID=3075543 RepID=A0ABU2MVX6_9ACTN|nr:hypothetical protein [Streptomyces sp. DSM 44938]MDT0345800.1 hypothetical protein [Streptomyces sp. DSM 44938]